MERHYEPPSTWLPHTLHLGFSWGIFWKTVLWNTVTIVAPDSPYIWISCLRRNCSKTGKRARLQDPNIRESHYTCRWKETTQKTPKAVWDLPAAWIIQVPWSKQVNHVLVNSGAGLTYLHRNTCHGIAQPAAEPQTQIWSRREKLKDQAE